jgi:hypothetical protein
MVRRSNSILSAFPVKPHESRSFARKVIYVNFVDVRSRLFFLVSRAACSAVTGIFEESSARRATQRFIRHANGVVAVCL